MTYHMVMSALRLILGNSQIRIVAIVLSLYGVAIASTLPYQSVIGIKELGLGNSSFALFMFASAVVNVVASVLLGALSDTMPKRKLLILALLACGIAGYGLIYVAPSQTIFIVGMLTLVPLARAVFPLLFGGVRRELTGTPDEITTVNSTIRAMFAASWVVAPGAVGWWLMDQPTMLPAFLVAAGASALGFGLYAIWAKPSDATPENRLGFLRSLSLIATIPILVRVLVMALGSGAQTLHSTLHPLVMMGPAHGTMRDVGIYAGLLAALEIPFMLIWARVTRVWPIGLALAAALLIYAVYAVFMAFATAPWHLYAIAILNSCGAAAILSLPVSAFQKLLKDRPGLGTSLVPVMIFAGSIMSAAAFALGTWISDYPGTAFVIAAMCVVGAAGLLVLERADKLAGSN